MAAGLLLAAGIVSPAYAESRDPAHPCASLGNCWAGLFSEIRQLAGDSFDIAEQAIANYEASARKSLAADFADRPDELKKPLYQLAAYRACLNECEALKEVARDGGTVDLLVRGRQFDANANLFEQAAQGYYELQVKNRCAGIRDPKAYDRCAKRVIILNEPGRERFFAFLAMLPPESVSSFTYVGHGLKDQIVFGPRTILRPKDPDVTMTRAEWTGADDGALYSEDLTEDSRFTRALRRTFRDNATATFYACNTGQQFARNFAYAAGIPKAEASLTGMNFHVKRADGVIEKNRTTNVRALKAGKGERYVLKSEKSGAFQSLKAERFSPSFITQLSDKLAQGENLYVPVDSRATLSREEVGWTVIQKVSAGSVIGAELDSGDNVQFSKAERQKINRVVQVVKKRVLNGNKPIEPEIVLDELAKKDPSLRDKLARLIDEGHEQANRSLVTRGLLRSMAKDQPVFGPIEIKPSND